MNTPAPTPRLDAEYFDGRSARGQAVRLRVLDDHLQVEGTSGRLLAVALSSVDWPERQRHGQRQLLLPAGGVLSVADAAAFDAWAVAVGRREGLAVRWQQSWRMTLLAALLTLAALTAGWRWGLPAASQVLVKRLPAGLEQRAGDEALAYLDQRLLSPSQLPAARQAAVLAEFEALVARTEPVMGPAPAWQLLFRKGNPALGPNAFALPGGLIVVTDQLVTMLESQPAALAGVLAHELGHVRHQHGLRLALQSGIAGALASVWVGDVSTVLAGLPTLLVTLGYSRDFEREADAHAHAMLRAGGLSPAAMVGFFEQLATWREREGAKSGLPALPIGFSSHPADAERIAFFSR